MLSKIKTATLHGIDGYVVDVECDLLQGLPALNVVGLPDATVKESRERIRSAIQNSGFNFPMKRITINLSPANERKEGSHFDLPMAISILAGSNKDIKASTEEGFIGELSLNGGINGVQGALPLVIAMKNDGIKKIFAPRKNAEEISLVKGVEIYPAENILEVVEHLSGKKQIEKILYNEEKSEKIKYDLDFSEVKGQESVKRAITICCAGAHGLFMSGAPGAGKTMLAKRIPTILPEMTYEECLEVTKIYSISGKLTNRSGMIKERPFRAPHHTITGQGLVGGGAKACPGEISLAHNGVLFLDEFPEFNKNIIEMLRQPLEDKSVTISRINRSCTFPCNVMFVAACNPCPCGYYGSQEHECTCTMSKLQHYRDKLSGPLMDRIDIQIDVMPVNFQHLSEETETATSKEMRETVKNARNIQLDRYKNLEINYNSQLTPKHMKEFCKIDGECKALLGEAFKRKGLSARAYGRVLKVARTIADMDNTENIQFHHIAEALNYRIEDRMKI